MSALKLKPEHKAVKDYYVALEQFASLGVSHETAVRQAFQSLLDICAKQRKWTVIPEWPFSRPNQSTLRVDAALVDNFNLAHGYWEAKDSKDDLAKEVQKKFRAGYPRDNILFQAPKQTVLYQDGQLLLEADLTKPAELIDALNAFCAYTPPEYEKWEKAIGEFQQRVPDLGHDLNRIDPPFNSACEYISTSVSRAMARTRRRSSRSRRHSTRVATS